MIVFSLRKVVVNVATTVVGGMLVYGAFSLALRRGCLGERETVRVVTLPEGKKLQGFGWRDADPWVMTRFAEPGESCRATYELTRPLGWAIGRERFVFKESEAVTVRDASADSPQED